MKADPDPATALTNLLGEFGSSGYGQAIAGGYSREMSEKRERTDPEYARQQQQLRAQNQAQTRVLADAMDRGSAPNLAATARSPSRIY